MAWSNDSAVAEKRRDNLIYALLHTGEHGALALEHEPQRTLRRVDLYRLGCRCFCARATSPASSDSSCHSRSIVAARFDNDPLQGAALDARRAAAMQWATQNLEARRERCCVRGTTPARARLGRAIVAVRSQIGLALAAAGSSGLGCQKPEHELRDRAMDLHHPGVPGQHARLS